MHLQATSWAGSYYQLAMGIGPSPAVPGAAASSISFAGGGTAGGGSTAPRTESLLMSFAEQVERHLIRVCHASARH